jgi:EAL domain-containing protein (putative c-di-GMP-specific phosphodiesterase class I)
MPVYVSLNISAKQIINGKIADSIIEKLEKENAKPENVILEITETVLMENIDIFKEEIEILNKYGVRVEIDDFGTGYSSLTYLKKLPIFALKIDREFIKDLPDDSEDVAITRAIISLSQSLDKKVIAEGVETENQLEFLKYLDCDYVQGYYFSPPVPPEKFEEFVKEFENKWKK